MTTTDLTRPGEVLVASAADVEQVVHRATNQYASGVVADTAGWADGDRRRIEDLGFRGGDSRGEALRTLDLTIADDGTPTRMLDAPAMAALNSHHARFAERRGDVVRYQTDVSVWTGIPAQPTAQDWEDVRALLGSGGMLGVGAAAVLPEGWDLVEGAGGVQLTGEAIEGAPDDEAVVLTPDDVPEMTALVERTKPGPFLPRTIELGTYLGIRRDGRLVAMAGSACTRRGGPRSARCARTTRTGGRGSGAGWCSPSRTGSGSGARPR